ncbi:hypothetical protein ACPF7Z_11110 [Halomonas sp. GXIMD04776]|uniref:hypothetical protein n=1 Tax=Halomonas sp. GXIMD04776 TaxID=3415605 RepID=UPI003CADB4F4
MTKKRQKSPAIYRLSDQEIDDLQRGNREFMERAKEKLANARESRHLAPAGHDTPQQRGD